MPCSGCQRRKKKLIAFVNKLRGKTMNTKDSLLVKLSKIKETPEKRERVLKIVQADKEKFKELDSKLAPKTREAFRNSLNGEMGKIIGS